MLESILVGGNFGKRETETDSSTYCKVDEKGDSPFKSDSSGMNDQIQRGTEPDEGNLSSSEPVTPETIKQKESVSDGNDKIGAAKENGEVNTDKKNGSGQQEDVFRNERNRENELQIGMESTANLEKTPTDDKVKFFYLSLQLI